MPVFLAVKGKRAQQHHKVTPLVETPLAVSWARLG